MSHARRSGWLFVIALMTVAAAVHQVSCSSTRTEEPQQSALIENQFFAHSGTRFHQSVRHDGLHQHYFHPSNPAGATGTRTMPTGPGTFAANDMLFVWVYLDSTDLPTEVMVQFMDEVGSFEHRAFWGADQIAWGMPGTGAHKQMCPQGNLCNLTTNTWQKLSVSAGDVGLTGHRVVGVAYTLFGGKAYWDEVGYNQTTWIDDETPPLAGLYQYWDSWYWAANKRNWLQFGGDPAHTGNNPLETQISTKNMAGIMPMESFTGMPPTSAAPVFLKGVAIPNKGTHDVLFVSSGDGLYAIDAYTGGSTTNNLWKASETGGGKASPAIDPSLQFVFSVDATTIHKFQVTNGALVAQWSLPMSEECKTAITIGTAGGASYLYVGTNGGGGAGVGHILAINLGSGVKNTFNANAGLWQRGGLAFDSIGQRLIAATGESLTVPWSPPIGWAHSVIGLQPDGSAALESYTPAAVAGNPPKSRGYLQSQDLDLSSTNTLILPNNGTYANFQRLAVQSGKDGYLRLINLLNMSGQGGIGHEGGEMNNLLTRLPTLSVPGFPECLESTYWCHIKVPIAAWINPADNKYWIFVNGPTGVSALRLDDSGSTVALTPVWNTPPPSAAPSHDDTPDVGGVFVANGVLYFGNGTGFHAVDATTGRDASGNFPPDGRGMDGAFHVGGTTQQKRQTPFVVNGAIYYNGAAFSLGGVFPAAYNLALRRPAFQSSIVTNFPTTPGLANDGNTDGDFYHGSVIHTNNGPLLTPIPNLPGNNGQLWSVDLGALNTVSRVVIFNRTDGGQSRLSNFRIVAYNPGNPPATQYTVVHSHPGAASDPVIVAAINPPVAASTIIVQAMCATPSCGTDDDYLNIGEVQVF